MKKKLMMVLFIVIIAVLVAACSSDKPSNTTTTPPASSSNNTNTPSNDTETEKPREKYKITHIAGTWASPIPAPNSEGVKLINERYNIEYVPQMVPYGEYDNVLPVTIAGGDIPDIIGMEGITANFAKWAGQGAFLPLNEYLDFDKYDALAVIPQNVWDAVSLDGNIYGIPFYFPPKYGKKPLIRKDWLDNLGLDMPTNYEELINVAIAFTENDPDQNGQDDTYGYGLAQRIVYGAWMGAYWDSGWYHRNDQGQLIPGNIAPAQKEMLTVLNRMYEGGAIHPDWAVTSAGNVRNDFFSGKIGIWYEQPYDFSIARFRTLKEIHPDAEIEVIPPFEQPDGERGFMGLSGYYELVALNADLAKDPGKIERILEMYNDTMRFVPVDERGPDHEFFDWAAGFHGTAYTIEDGAIIEPGDTRDLAPKTYINSRYWVASDEENEIQKVHTYDFARQFVENAVQVLADSKLYLDPVNRIHSEVKMSVESELNEFLRENFTRMIVGQDPIDNFDQVVQQYLNKGGKDMIDDVNRILDEMGIGPEWR